KSILPLNQAANTWFIVFACKTEVNIMNKEIIKFIRKNYEMTQRDFAKVVNCSFALIALVEVGKRNVSKELEHKVKTAFNIDDQDIQSITTIISEFTKGIPPFM
ncbi:helix-turn-helix transcriptional regulator, partial [Niallia taxi]